MEPAVSIVIPTYNRRDLLAKTLHSLLDQTVDPDIFEVVVVDDGSTDDTPGLVAEMAARAPWRLHYVRQENLGRARARNEGILAAKGRLVIFLDSDMVVRPGFVQAHLDSHTRPGLIVQGRVITTSNFENPTTEPVKVTDLSRATFDTGNVSVARQSLLAAGLFDEDFVEYGWEDFELGARLRGMGLEPTRSGEACSYHLKRPLNIRSLPGMVRLEKERGRMGVMFFRKHPTMRVRMMVNLHPLTFILDRFFLAPFHWTERPGTMRLLKRLEAAGNKRLFAFLVFLVRNHAYVQGLREGLARYP